MAERFQYPIWAAIDPETLDAPLRDEVQWFQEFSIPVLPIPSVAEIPSFFIDPEALGDPLDDKIEWFQSLSEPIRRIDRLIEAGNIFVDEPPAALVTDELEWFQALSTPEPLPAWRHSEAWVTDQETLNAALRDEIEWWQPFSEPVRIPPSSAHLDAGGFNAAAVAVIVAAVAPPKHEGLLINVGTFLD